MERELGGITSLIFFIDLVVKSQDWVRFAIRIDHLQSCIGPLIVSKAWVALGTILNQK
jgi:hypothetical protein